MTKSPMVLAIRPALSEDARGIARVSIKGWQVAYRGIFPDNFLDGLSDDLDERAERMRAAITSPERPETVALVAVDGEEIVGWLSYGPSRDDDAGPSVGEMYTIYVHPDHWGTGAGHALLGEGVAGLRGAGFEEATLWVLVDNARARAFYERHGWQEDGSVETFERGGASTLEMRYRYCLADRAGG